MAETGSFSRAGTALNVGHAAVGQQVKALEVRLGVILVTRRGRGITLTARSFVEAEVKSGQLLELFEEKDSAGCYIVTRPGAPRPPAREFVKWPKRQAETETAT